MENTVLHSVEEFDKVLTEAILTEIYNALLERGYDPIKQLTGYLMSGDPGYISSYKDARKKITGIDRSKIIEYLLDRVVGE